MGMVHDAEAEATRQVKGRRKRREIETERKRRERRAEEQEGLLRMVVVVVVVYVCLLWLWLCVWCVIWVGVKMNVCGNEEANFISECMWEMVLQAYELTCQSIIHTSNKTNKRTSLLDDIDGAAVL